VIHTPLTVDAGGSIDKAGSPRTGVGVRGAHGP